MNIEARKILHVGCGGEELPHWMMGKETRLDLVDDHKPDILASMIDMGDIGLFDIVYSSHSLEHLALHDIKKALAEFIRVLHPGGFALIVVPDLEDIKPNNDVVYESMGGSITGLDMYYGYSKMVEEAPFMAHKYGFVESTLRELMGAAGFKPVHTRRLKREFEHNLMAVGIK
jgi:SAM-dependent methyltransferase